MRVLVTGARGQLGLDLLDAYADHEVVGLSRQQLDVGDEAAVAATVADLGPDLVVNAAAWTDVDGCEADPDRAHRTNALGAWWLARACQRTGATMVQVSTDYVFSGPALLGSDGRPRGWSEFDPPRPGNVYGRSKAAGEHLVRSTLGPHHVVRTGWLGGARGRNFVRTMLQLGRQRDHVEVVDDQTGSPTFSRDLAEAVRAVSVSGRHGTIHLVNAGRCSWFELACATFELAGLDAEVVAIRSHQLGRPAARPGWSVLDDLHSRTSGIGPLPHWRDGLWRLLQEVGAPAVGDRH